MLRFLFLMPFAAGLAGCMTTGTGSEVPAAENQSTVLVHTSLHDARCGGITMTLVQKDASGRWVSTNGRVVTLKTGYENAEKTLSQVTLPAGEYGIINLHCGAQRVSYAARVVDKPSFLDRNKPIVYDRALATFKVLPSEVVDIGSLRVPSGTRLEEGRIKHVFVGVVTPTPEAALRTLAEKHPDLYQRRVTRPMQAAVNI